MSSLGSCLLLSGATINSRKSGGGLTDEWSSLAFEAGLIIAIELSPPLTRPFDFGFRSFFGRISFGIFSGCDYALFFKILSASNTFPLFITPHATTAILRAKACLA